MENITISMARFEQLLRAEHDANQMKALILEKLARYESIEREELMVLQTVYCGKEG